MPPLDRERACFELASADDLLAAVDVARAMGLSGLETFTPYAIPEVDAKLGGRRTRIPLAVLTAGAIGCALAYAILWYCNAHDYPLTVGGRPFNSIPADVPIMFETTVLFAGVTALLSVLFLSGMPRLHHPIFEVEGSEAITLDKFWLVVDDGPAIASLREKLAPLGAVERTRGAS